MREEASITENPSTAMGSAAEVSAGKGAATEMPISWLSSLPEELKSSPSLGKFKDVTSLASSYLEAEKSLSQKVSLPKAESSDEEWYKFYQKLGMPEDKKYTDQRKAEDEEYLSKYEDMFYRSGLTHRQGSKLLEHLYNFSQDLQKQQDEGFKQTRHANIEWLKSNYGDSFDHKITIMQAALSKFGTKELASLIEESHYSPALVDLLVKVGEVLKSDSLVTGSEPAVVANSDTALKEIKKLEADSEFMAKLSGKNNTGHDEAVKKMEELYRLAYNNGK